jgi:hypothetical protein
MFLHVSEVKYLGDYRLWLRFDNGQAGEIDLESELWGEIFEPLKEKRLFSQVYLNKEIGTICWTNGADFAPEYLYELVGLPLKKAA